MRKAIMAAFGIILISILVGVYFYPQMPDRMASHWGASGEVNGYTSRFWGLFLLPVVSAGLLLLFVLIPVIDPLRQNIMKFRAYYELFILAILAFMFYIYLLSILWNLNFRFNFVQALVPAYAAIVYSMGVLVGKAKRNWFIGIRTPWTLASERVWDKTHRLGGKLFKIGGLVTFLGLLLPGYASYFILVPLLSIAVYTVVYSYFEYQKQH